MNNQQKIIIGVLVAIVVIGGLWYFQQGNNSETNTNQAANANSVTTTEYSNNNLGIALQLPVGWQTVADHSFKADVVFQNSKCKENGCAVYVTRENNDAGLTVDAWLANTSPRDYVTQEEYDRRRSTGTPSERTQAGTFEQSTGQLGNQSAIIQNYASEGGGYIRYFVPRSGSIYVLTLWSDGYYFNDTTKQNQYDRGQLKGEVDILVSSFTFLQ